jgi:hypothetical protein
MDIGPVERHINHSTKRMVLVGSEPQLVDVSLLTGPSNLASGSTISFQVLSLHRTSQITHPSMRVRLEEERRRGVRRTQCWRCNMDKDIEE